MSLRNEERNKTLKQAKTGFVDLAAKHFLYEFRKDLEHLESDQVVPDHAPVGKDLFIEWIRNLLEKNQSFIPMKGILENEKMLKEFAVQVAADIGESPTGVKNPMRGYEKKVDPTMVVASKKVAQKADIKGKGLYDSPEEHSRYCPDHPGAMLRRVKDNIYQCPISGDLAISEPWKEKFSYENGHTVEFKTGVQNQTLDGWNYFHPVSPFLSPNKKKDMDNINNVKGKEYDFEKLYGVSATPPPVSEYKKKTNKKDADLLGSLFKTSTKSYQLYAPTTMMTRQCPDHPGQQLQRISDNVRQCSLDGKVYDFERGFETEDGEKHLGGSVSNQMAIPPGYSLSVQASLSKEATDASVHSFLYNHVLPHLPATAEYARRVLNYKFSQPGMSLDDALTEIRKADQLAEQAKAANLKGFVRKKADKEDKSATWKAQVYDVLGSDYNNSELDFNTWSEMIFSGEMPDAALELLNVGDQLYGTERASDMFSEIVERFQKTNKIASKKKSSKPKKVTEIARAIERDNPGTSPEAAYKMAWETLCSYVNPSYEGCTSKGKSHRKSPKSSR